MVDVIGKRLQWDVYDEAGNYITTRLGEVVGTAGDKYVVIPDDDPDAVGIEVDPALTSVW